MRLATLLVLFSLTFYTKTSQSADWTGFKGCGLYQVRGVVKYVKNTPTMIVNEGTKSEIQLSVPILNEPKLSPYIDQPFVAEVKILSPMNGSLGRGEVVKIETRLPHPLNPKDTGLTFIKNIGCDK